MTQAEQIKKALNIKAQRDLARLDFKSFLLQKWQYYNKATFNDNWHFTYLAKILEHTLPPKPNEPKRELITRAMINMPPSYGKTETIARGFIAWALGQNRKRKIIYISYSDELCRKISNQVRDLLKSKLWANVFLSPPQFLQDNSAAWPRISAGRAARKNTAKFTIPSANKVGTKKYGYHYDTGNEAGAYG